VELDDADAGAAFVPQYDQVSGFLSFLLMTLGPTIALIPLLDRARGRVANWSLGLLYLVWGSAIVMLYFPCRWYADLKARRSDLGGWLKYL